MRERWLLPTIVSLSLSFLAMAGVVLLALVSCATPDAVESPGLPGAAQQPSEAIAGLRDLQTSFNYIGDTVSPSVVRIDVRERVTQNGPQEGLPFFDYFFGRPDDEEPRDRGFELGGVGSGVIVSSDRRRYYVLTNDHVVGAADTITVVLNDGTEFDAELVGRDSRKDLAMVSIQSDRDLPVARLGDSDSLRVGDWVVAIGSPFGYRNTITVGIVSAMGRRGGPDGNISDFIQTDASINQGNSGGALVNLDGEVVGINTWITSDSGGSIGLGFAIPINNVVRSIAAFLGDGEVEYGWLGVSIQTVDAEQVANLKIPGRSGALVDSVFGNSPADRSGILPGDFIYQIGEMPVSDSDELVLLIGELPIGEPVDFLLIRNGEAVSIPVALAARETDAAIGQLSRLRWPGFSVYPLTREIAEETGLEVNGGVIITTVDQGSPAGIGGLRAFDIVTSINGTAVDDLLSFYRIIADPDLKEWRFAGVRDGEELEVTVVR
jgi:serine protease Do